MSCSLPAKRLYLRGLGKDISTEDLSQFLSRYGEILEVKIVHNYAFVEYASPSDAQLVYNIYQYDLLLGKRVVIQYARPLRKDIAAARNGEMAENRSPLPGRRSSRESSRHPIVVIGLSHDVRWQELKDFGRSTGCLVAFCDLDRSNPECGFLEYFTKEDAEYAVRSLDGTHLGGNVVRVLSYNDYSADRKNRRSRGRSPCRPLYPTNRPTDPAFNWDHPQYGPWGGYDRCEGGGSQESNYQPLGDCHRPATYPPTYGDNRGGMSLIPRASFGESSYSGDDSAPRYNPSEDLFREQTNLDSSYRYDVRVGCFSDNYHNRLFRGSK